MVVNEDIRAVTQVRAWKDADSADALAGTNADLFKEDTPGGGIVRPREFGKVTGVILDDSNIYTAGRTIKFTTATFSGGNPEATWYRYYLRYRLPPETVWTRGPQNNYYDNTAQEVELTIPIDLGGYEISITCQAQSGIELGSGSGDPNPPDLPYKYASSTNQTVSIFTLLYTKLLILNFFSPELNGAVVGDTITYKVAVFAGGTPDSNVYEHRYGYYDTDDVFQTFTADLVGAGSPYIGWQPYDNAGGTFTLPLTDDTISELPNGADWFAGKNVVFQVRALDPTNGNTLSSGIGVGSNTNTVQPREFEVDTVAATFDPGNVYEVGETITFTLGQWFGGYPYPDSSQTGNNYEYGLQYENDPPGSNSWTTYPGWAAYTYDENLTKTVELPADSVNKKTRVSVKAHNSDMGMSSKAAIKVIPGATVGYGPIVITGAPKITVGGVEVTSVDWKDTISFTFPDVSVSSSFH